MPDLALAGDVMLGRLVDEHLGRVPPEEPWSRVAHLWDDADAFFYNLECALCGDLPEWEAQRKTFHFRLDPSHAATLTASGVDAVALANNHAMDFGVEGLLATMRHLDGLGIAHTGAGHTLDEAQAGALVRTPHGTIGLVSAADHERAWAASARSPGIFLIDPHAPADLERLAVAIARTRVAGADHVVVALHWGPNMRRVPPPSFRAFARGLVEAGADVVWGTSAHLTQGIEFHRAGVILYDTGDFLDDYRVDPDERNDLSFLFRVRLRDGPPEVVLHPVAIEACATRPATQDERAWLRARMRPLCAHLGTRLEDEGGALRIARSPTHAVRHA